MPLSKRRNAAFESPGRPVPYEEHDGVHLVHNSVKGPLSFFNPTSARYHISKSSRADSGSPSSRTSADDTQALIPGAEVAWRSRDNRKGRHVLIVDGPPGQRPAEPTSNFRHVLHNIWRMATVYPYWDVSWLVAVFFTIGCLIFIVCGLFAWLPIAYPKTEFQGESDVASGVTAFVGATLFQIGAVFLVFEACNENRTGCFGWAVHQAIAVGHEDGGKKIVKPDPSNHCTHRHRRGGPSSKHTTDQESTQRTWEWWPTWYELKTHYIHEIGFLASTSLALGATIFYVSGILSLPGVYNNLSLGVLQGVYWFTYLLGGVIFVFSSVLYVLEVQPNWYTPMPHLLGWHIGVWNLIGSIGWTLAASFGYCTATWCEYQSELTLIWASVAFTVGSALLWYESMEKYPVEVRRK